MKKLLFLLIVAIPLCAQETVNNSGAAKVIPFPVVTATPGSCSDGQVITRIDLTSGANVYICKNNAWSQVGSSATGSVTAFSVTSVPSWLSSLVATPTTTPALTLSAATGQTSHLVLGTCGSATSFAPCALVAGDIPQLTATQMPNPSATTLGGIESLAAVSHNFLTSISTLGVPAQAQPAFTDISGSVAAGQLPNPSASTLGGIESLAAQSSKWINAISTSGVPSATQPAFSDLTGSATAAQMPAFTGAISTSAGSTATTLGVPSVFGGRLTLTSGTAVTTSDVTGASTIYYTAYASQYVSLYDGSKWQVISFTNNKSLALSSLTSGKNYDVFGFLSSGDLALELSAAWTSDTARADALATQDGVQVKSADHTRVLLGTIRTTGTTTTEDSGGGTTTQVGGKRFVWNAYNKVSRSLSVIDTTANWAYSTATIRQADGATGNKVEWVTGEAGTMLNASVVAQFAGTNNTSSAGVGAGIDSTTAFSGLHTGLYNNSATNQVQASINGSYGGYPGLGYHYAAWLEIGAGASSTSTFIGSGGAQSGLNATLNFQ